MCCQKSWPIDRTTYFQRFKTTMSQDIPKITPESTTQITQNISKLSIRQNNNEDDDQIDETLYNNDRTKKDDSEVVVTKGSGKVKVRKGQSEEEYSIQRDQYLTKGPTINTINWLEEIDITKLNPDIKSDRTSLESLTERLYFKRDYVKCLEVTEFALDFVKDQDQKRIKNEIDELIYLQKKCKEILKLT
ncbi:hypothetical protein WICMUC_003154 [Wickerhamomyces mucosus]|uniref:Uncharacterized protein n=1 Tax=Wickerhamomyces mucosus TaxID=1378264 RepID=A0A9P8PLS0_9ASCO|nr:hypothetical protein WICMUC_003154 [Wickerhamomyces mucosus]